MQVLSPAMSLRRLLLPPLMYSALFIVISLGVVVQLDGAGSVVALAVVLGVGVTVGGIKSFLWWLGPCRRQLVVADTSLVVQHGEAVELEVPLRDILTARMGDGLMVRGVVVPGYGSDAPRLRLTLRDGSVVTTRPFFLWGERHQSPIEEHIRRAAREARAVDL